ncbi:DUF1801 domain-containing protein [Microtetraspora malaysiensis]|uniref:DUF1801 domain-containing protein n=1 Tax=Microtetraspora malaysiensis TaxID=161358 RepID=UPI003D8C7EE3
MTKPATVHEYIASLPESHREIGAKLLPVIEEVLPGVGAVWHGHPVWSLGPAPGKQPVAFVKAYANYLTFGLWRGQEIDDSSGRLEPAARAMAAVKLRSVDEIDAELFADWLRQGRDLEG